MNPRFFSRPRGSYIAVRVAQVAPNRENTNASSLLPWATTGKRVAQWATGVAQSGVPAPLRLTNRNGSAHSALAGDGAL